VRTVVVVGGVAGGMSTAARLRRLDPQARIVVVEQGAEVSFANCGLPYFVGGEIERRESLLLHTPASLARTLGLDVRVRTEALSIDRAARTLTMRGPAGPETIGYDALVLAPGAAAVRPPIPGVDHPRVRTLRTVPDAEALRDWVTGGARTAVVLGAGFIGLEAVEALSRAGLSVTLVEAAPHVLPVLDPELASWVCDELRAHGVAVHEGMAAARIEDRDGQAVVTLGDGTELAADLVVLSVGVRPRTELARAAGLELTDAGAIVVDDQQRTSDPHIWAVGDATASAHATTGALAPVALATPANRGGRVAADSIVRRAGRHSPDPLGTAVVRVFGLTVAMTGAPRRALGERAFHTARVHSGHHAGYYPGATPMHLVLHFGPDGQILGAQGVGQEGIDKRIDVIATAARAGLHADDLVDLDLCYAPPFGSAKDPVMILGMIADNVLSGVLVQADPVTPLDPQACLVLDVRNRDEWDRGHVAGAMLVPQPEVGGALESIREQAAGRPIVVHCASGFRSYLAHRTLAGAGMPSASLSGGFTTLSRTQPEVVAGPALAVG
jgi:NADPH-dependent 2,4-dienoyl-CoA reductase/sulfur reductase-like enzyme/rhodanese-related sulfurtransferase